MFTCLRPHNKGAGTREVATWRKVAGLRALRRIQVVRI